jgi:Zn-finger nucleic acid-binding protein
MNCLLDHGPLHQKTFDGVTIEECVVCNGVWLGGGELKALSNYWSRKHPTPINHEIINNAITEPRDFWVEIPLQCPKCHGHLKKQYFAGTKVGMDRCFYCGGFWVEGEELLAIKEHVKPDPVSDALGALQSRRHQQCYLNIR